MRLPAECISFCCRQCWAQSPYDRPDFAAVVPRLRSVTAGGRSSRSRQELACPSAALRHRILMSLRQPVALC